MPFSDPKRGDVYGRLLRVSARLSKSVTAILDLDELLQHTVDVICDELNYDYAGIFLLDESGQWATLRTGRGEAGQKMLAEGHKLSVGGNSMVGMAIVQHAPWLAQDTSTQTIIFRNPHLTNTRSEAALPIMFGDQVLGALSVQSSVEQAFSPADLETLTAITSQLAGAINNQRRQRKYQDLLRQAERRTALLRAASHIGRLCSEARELNSLLAQVVEEVCACYGFYYAGIFLLDEAGEWAVLHAGTGAPGAKMLAEGHRLKVGGNSMVGAATSLCEARIALDVGEERVHFKNPHLPNTRSEMALPLQCAGKVLGAATIQSVEERAFSQDDITTLQTICDHLAVAIQNLAQAQALADSRRRVERLPVLEAAVEVAAADLNRGTRRGKRPVKQVNPNLRPLLIHDVWAAAATNLKLPKGMLQVACSDPGLLVNSDSALLERALNNLLRAAVSPDTLHLWLDISYDAGGQEVVSRFYDPGENLPVQLEGWLDTDNRAGCVLALARLHAALRLEKQPDGAIMAEIRLPAAQPGAPADFSAAPDRLLLLDDDDAWANFVADTLADAGKTISRRASGRIDPAADLILIDEALQGTALPELLKSIAAQGLAHKALLLSVSGQAEAASSEVRVALKPYTAVELAALLTEAAQPRRRGKRGLDTTSQ